MSASPVSSEPLWRPVPGNPNAIEVNLAADPERPFKGAKIAWRWGAQTGWVRLELKDGYLYRDGKKVTLHLDPVQVNDYPQGHTLHKNLERSMAGVALHPNIKNALMVPGNQHLLPESWKVNAAGHTLLVYFWALGFRYGRRCRYVEFIFSFEGVWRDHHCDLNNHFGVFDRAAQASLPTERPR